MSEIKPSICDLKFNFNGKSLGYSNEQRQIFILRMNDIGVWEHSAHWEAHDGPILSLSWAHPEFGSILASSSSDCQVIVWEEVEEDLYHHSLSSRWVSRACLSDMSHAVLSIEFAPRFFGILLVFTFLSSLLNFF